MNRTLSTARRATAVAMLASFIGCHGSSSAEPQSSAGTTAAVRVAAAQPARKTLRRESIQPGQIEAFEQTPLFVKFPAYVLKLYVDIGDRVDADQPLVDLFLPEMKDELHQKEAMVVQCRAEIELAIAATRAAEAAIATARANISAAEAGTIRAEADVARWKSQFARISLLVSGGSLDRKLEDETRDAMKAAEAADGESRAKVEAARATLVQSQADLAKAKANEAVAHARCGNAEADVSRVKSLLQYTQIRAPYAGVVTERNVNRGDFVQPASAATAKPLLAVARMDIVRIFVDVPEMEAPSVHRGQTGYVAVQALPDRIVEGAVTRTSWILSANRTLHTELDLPNPSGLLRPGMYATAHIVLQERPDVYVLPPSAIVREGKQASCWIVKDARALRIPLTLGLQVGNDVEIASGLKGDELVVQSQVASLQEGRPVEVTQTVAR